MTDESPLTGCPAVDRDAANAARFQANLALFRAHAPHIAARLEAIRTPQSRLIAVGDDDWDIEFGGVPLYGIGAKATAAAQADPEFSGQLRLLFTHPRRNEYDRQASDFRDRFDAAVEANGLTPEDGFLGEDAFHVVCMGVGLGFHLPGLLDRTRCRNIVLLEIHPEFLLHSLSVFDWAEVLDPQRRNGLTLSFVLDLDIAATPVMIREMLRASNPTLIDGTLLYLHYPNPDYTQLYRRMLKDVDLALAGLGFMTDDIRMVRNSYLCLKDDRSRMFRASEAPRDWPVIIVGSGPSLDQTIDDLKRNADRAVIIACGTALPALLRHGVRPDLFTILENTPAIYDYLKAADESWGLDGITLIASTTVDPRVPAMFGDSVLFLRSGLASHPLFNLDPAMTLEWVQPTVTNTGLATALGFGFRTVYLFGVDLGSREPARHHSAASPYHADGLEFTATLDMGLPGNFGGTVYASHVFLWACDAFEQAISVHRRGVQVINCSDGIFIRGTTPKLARTLTLPEPATPKAEVLRRIVGSLEPFGAERFRAAWSLERLVAEQTELRDALKASLDDAEDGRALLARLMPLMLRPGARPAHHFIRGTLMQMMIVVGYYVLRTRPEKAQAMTDLARRQLAEEIDSLTGVIVGFLADLDSGATVGPWLCDPKGIPTDL